MKNLGRFVVLACILSAIPAYASDFTIFGAAQHQGKLSVQSASATASSVSNFIPGTFGTFGIRYGGGKVVGHETTLAYAPNFLDNNTKAVIFNGNFLVQAPVPKVKPYVTAGMGTIISFGTDSAGRPSLGKIGKKFAINYGGGLKVLPAGPVGVRFDIRGYRVPGVKFNLPSIANPTQTVQAQSQSLDILEAGMGIVFSFGK